ncbi:MAG: glutamine--tRNA ligase/YqeY domain fusion protein [Oceanococcaceae bacterium]
MTESRLPSPRHFLETRVVDDLTAGRLDQGLITRFPPEPNGFLHIGHAKSICLNFGLAQRYGGHCHLRFDDTNPEAEEQQYLDAIQADIRWLGFAWDGPLRYTSSYFETLYSYAEHLIRQGDAYVCDLPPDQAREYRGTLTEAGRNSPYRERSVDENLQLFQGMRAGQFANGEKVLRAKIDMASPNMNLRDPILYRIRHAAHHQTGEQWCIYPTYDFAHGQSDAIEQISHSLCSLEFEDHRPLYDWLLDHLPVPARPVQIEFARLELNYTVTSKRKLKRLVDEGHVSGWDDPRMPTLAGLRRRGFPAAGIRAFIEAAGVARANSLTDVAMLEAAIRDELNRTAPRAMGVLNPIRLVITNWASDQEETLTAPFHPDRPELGQRPLTFARELLIEAEDFQEEANKKFKRLVLGKRVRLRHAYVIEATHVDKDATGRVTTVYANAVPETVGQDPADGVKPKGVIHWVPANRALRAQVRIYDRLFAAAQPGQGDRDFIDDLNPESLTVTEGWLEPALENVPPETVYQFERLGYFVADRHDHRPDAPVFNRAIALRDTWERQSAN